MQLRTILLTVVVLVGTTHTTSTAMTAVQNMTNGVYKGEQILRAHNFFDGLWEWTQHEANVDRLEAQTVAEATRPTETVVVESIGSVLRNLAKLWVAFRACANGSTDIKSSDDAPANVLSIPAFLLALSVGGNAMHAWLRRNATHMNTLDTELFAAYNRRLTEEQVRRLTLVQKKLRREIIPFKLMLRQLPSRVGVWQEKKENGIEKSPQVLWSMLLDAVVSIRLRGRRADYIDIVLREAHAQYDPILAALKEAEQRLAACELELTKLLATEVEDSEKIQEARAVCAVLRARHKELERHEKLLRGGLPLEELPRQFDNDTVTRQICVLTGE